MDWVEHNVESGKTKAAPAARAKVLDKVREEALPVIAKQAEKGQIPFEGVRRQPVRSPGNYEAEFLTKGTDLIFHVWPYGHAKAKRAGTAVPRFSSKFEGILRATMESAFGKNRIAMDYDKDMGSWFVKATGWAEAQFARDLAIKTCENLHKALGGE
jgi:hypothetical protein